MKWYQIRVNEFFQILNNHYYGPRISKRLHKKFYTCQSCEELIPDEEIHYPSVDLGGDFMCDDCYDDEFRFFCPLCCDLDVSKECDEIGSIIILTDQGQAVGVKNGAYEIMKFPYVRYGEPFMRNLKRICDYKSKEFAFDDCWTGTVKICRTCQERIVKKSLLFEWLMEEKTIADGVRFMMDTSFGGE